MLSSRGRSCHQAREVSCWCAQLPAGCLVAMEDCKSLQFCAGPGGNGDEGGSVRPDAFAARPARPVQCIGCLEISATAWSRRARSKDRSAGPSTSAPAWAMSA